jgi:hypothetical protein
VRCTATDGVRAVTAEIRISVENPDHAFAGSRTVLVAPDGDVSEAPASPFGGAYEVVRAVEGRIRGRRLLFQRGHRHVLTRNLSLRGEGRDQQVGAWGRGAPPVLSCLAATGRTNVLRLNRMEPDETATIWGLDLESSWDAATETARGGTFPWDGMVLGASAHGHVTVQDCRFSGFDTTLQAGSTAARIVVSGTTIENWRNFGFFGSQGVLAFVGCRLEQDVDAMGGGAVPRRIRGAENLQNDHGPIRVSGASPGTWMVLSQTQMRSVNGWSPGNAAGRRGPRPSHQACLRWNTASRPDGVLRIDRVVAEGGNPAINVNTFRRDVAERRCDAIVDKLITVGTSNNRGGAWATGFMGAVCRNFVIVVPPTAGGVWELAPRSSLMSYGGGRGYDARSLEGRIHVYSGTVLDWSGIDKALLRDRMPEGQAPRSLIVSNLLHHAPFYAEAPRDLGAALRLAAIFEPSYRGLKWQNRYKTGETFVLPGGRVTDRPNTLQGVPDSPVLDTAHASLARLPDGTPTVALPFPVPDALPAALGPGEKVALDDLLGRLRGPMPHAGALEPR